VGTFAAGGSGGNAEGGGIYNSSEGVKAYNNASDWSLTSNPNGVWSYGQLSPGSTPLSSTFSLYTFAGVSFNNSIDFVSANAGLQPPYVSYNPSNSVIRRR
jgi:hypothetical protein